MAKSRDTVATAAILLCVLLFAASPAESRTLPSPPARLVAEDDAAVDSSKFACQPTDCGPTERCIRLPFGMDKCWVMDCPCKKKADVVAVLDDSPEMYCSAEQCGINVTKCITVPVKGDICWEVTCPPCGIPGRDIPDAEALQAAVDKKKKDDDDKKKFGCLPEECDMDKEVCIAVPVVGDICWNVTCPACNATKPDTEPAVRSKALFKKASTDTKKKGDEEKKKFGCLPSECDTVKQTCITVPVAGDICWNVTCPACNATKPNTDPVEPEEVLLFKKASADKKRKDDDKKKFGCLPEECDMDKEVCITVPVAGDICWNVTCPACNATKPDAKPEKEVLLFKKSSADKKKKDDDKKKFGCLPEECDMDKEVCITVPVAGDICWNVTCPACKPAEPDTKPVEPEEVLLLFKKSSADKKKKKDDDKKKFGCLPEECGMDKEVCITVPVAGDICWNVTCPACKPAEPEGTTPAEETVEMVVFKKSSVDKKKDDDGKKKFGCLPEECDMDKEVCMAVPVVGDICWNVTCPACKPAEPDTKPVEPDAQQQLAAEEADALAKKKRHHGKKKKYGCTPADCGTTKRVCMDVPVKGEVCWDVKCPKCPEADVALW